MLSEARVEQTDDDDETNDTFWGGFDRYTKQTRRVAFLAEMNCVVPWKELCELIEPFRAYRVVTPSQKRWLFSGIKWDGTQGFGIMKTIR